MDQFQFHSQFSRPILRKDDWLRRSADSFAIWFQSGALHAEVSSASATSQVDYTFVPTAGQWYDLAMTFDGSSDQLVFYVNGSASKSTSGTVISIGYDTHPVIIGADNESNSPALFFPGKIDEPVLYNRALNASEVLQLTALEARTPRLRGPPAWQEHWRPVRRTFKPIH